MKRILTWLQATAEQIHIWNYFWAIKPMLELVDQYKNDPTNEFFVFIANMHSLNTIQDWKQLVTNTKNLIKCYLACGLDKEKVVMFNQSDVPAHAQLKVILETITTLWFMKRMHKYKDFIQNGKEDEINMWTATYPILMAWDILLYDVDIVPVGKDNKQHMEFARDIAGKFNHMYGETFKLPWELIQEDVALIQWLDWRKMSKSYNNFIGIFEEDDMILKKVKSIPTDAIPVADPKDPDKCNIYNMIKLFLNEQENTALRNRYTQWGLSYKEAKDYLFEKLSGFIWPIREKSKSITDEEVFKLLEKNAQIANNIATKKIKDVYEKVWFTLK